MSVCVCVCMSGWVCARAYIYVCIKQNKCKSFKFQYTIMIRMMIISFENTLLWITKSKCYSVAKLRLNNPHTHIYIYIIN